MSRQRAIIAEDEGKREGPSQLAPGLSLEITRTVLPEMSARHLGSGDVGVLATPAMIGLMEGTSMRCVQPYLEDGQTTVGYLVNVRHLAPTPIGKEVTVRSTVDDIQGRRITYAVGCWEGDKKVGDGQHVRVIVDSSRFLEDATGNTR